MGDAGLFIADLGDRVIHWGALIHASFDMAESTLETSAHAASGPARGGGLVLKRVLLSAVICLVLLKGVDLLVGLAWQAPVSHSVSRSIILRENPPNQDTFMTPGERLLGEAEGLEKKACRFRTDRDGFIIGPADVAAAGKTGAVDFLFLGGSTTECRYVEEESRFPYRVSQLIQDVSGRPVRTLNGGVPGNHSMHSLLNCLAKGLAGRPRHVVLMHAVNDLGTLVRTSSYWEGPPGRRLIQETPPDKESGLMVRTVRLGKDALFPNLWKLGRRWAPDSVTSGEDQDEWAAYRGVKRSAPEVEEVLQQQFKPSLLSFVAVCRAWKVEPVLMTQFNRIRDGDPAVKKAYDARPQPVGYADFVKLYQTANEIVREVAQETGTPLIDLDRLVPGDARHLYDAVHLHTPGSRVVADVIGKELVRLLPGGFRMAEEP